MARDALGLLDGLGIGQAHVGGYSLGGAIAQEMALAVPERVLSLSLYSSYDRPEPHMRLRYELLTKILLEGTPEQWAMFTAFSAFGADFVNAHEDEVRAEIAKRARRWQGDDAPSKQGLAGHYAAILAHDTLDRLGDIRCRTWLAVGTADPVTPPLHAKRMHAAIRGSRLSLYEGKPHRILNFQAEAFTQDALAFLLDQRSTA
jgi:pimeloyl-ACP methyl ester carboxylesterase